ncbi:hypothetical protein MKEN_01459800 [Mycena kentingensis (nom. inval.)]|nr:hypothetical protein MKEN_01459800 [Mycena kentingensis (nom. inval.)]
MSLTKKGSDRWTSTGVQSSFSVIRPSEPDATVTGTTELCGWGWRLEWELGPHVPRGYMLRLRLDPHLIAGATYGSVQVAVAVKKLFRGEDAALVSPADHINLPADPTRPLTPLGTWYSSKIVQGARVSARKGNTVVTLTLEFDSALRLPLLIAPAIESPAYPREKSIANPHEQPLPNRALATLASTIRGGEVIDLKFYAYNKRVGAAHVADPRPIYANITLIRGVSARLDEAIDDWTHGFAEATLVDIDATTCSRSENTNYLYDDDSDLEDGDGDLTDCEADGGAGEGSTAEPAIAAQATGSQAVASGSTTPAGRVRLGHKIEITGYAYDTWVALIHYICTGQVVFRKIGVVEDEEDDAMPTTSPKSMYKLADEYGLDDLKSLARASISSQLTEANIVRECFSKFTSLFSEIRVLQVDYLLARLGHPQIRADMAIMLRDVCVSGSSSDILHDIIFGTRIASPVAEAEPTTEPGINPLIEYELSRY